MHSVIIGLSLVAGLFLVEERADTDAACFGAEVAAEGVGAGKAAVAAPGGAGEERSGTDVFLFAGVEAFVAFSVVLARKGFAADGADEGTFVGVGAEMGAEVVGSGEAFGAEIALVVCWMFLDSLFFSLGGEAGKSH